MALPLIVAIGTWAGGKFTQAAGIAALVSVAYWLRDYLRALVVWIYQLFQPFFDALFTFAKDVFIWLTESILDLVILIIGDLQFDFSLFNPASYISGVGPEIINTLAVLKVPQAIAMILGAIVIRLLLQLIPFTRLGS